MAQVPSLSEAQRRHLLSLVREAWDAYLPIGEAQDRPFEMGLLLYEMGCYSDALELFNTSGDVYGPQPGTLYNIAACLYRLNDVDRALAAVSASLELDPNFDAARALRLMIEDTRG
jgi:tetratricopeptide (TPR) repeat protein